MLPKVVCVFGESGLEKLKVVAHTDDDRKKGADLVWRIGLPIFFIDYLIRGQLDELRSILADATVADGELLRH